jgi:cysteine synthase A
MKDGLSASRATSPAISKSRTTKRSAPRALGRQEGIFAGFSSGANAAAALQRLETSCQGQTIAILMCDSGLKYLSTACARKREAAG